MFEFLQESSNPPGLWLLHDATSGGILGGKKIIFELAFDCERGNSCCLCVMKWNSVGLHLQFIPLVQRVRTAVLANQQHSE